jgi:hypothetical protein
MSFPLNPSNGQQTIINGIKYNYTLATNSWRRDFNNVLDRLFLVGNNQAINTSTGDLVVSGGAGFGKNLYVGGALDVSGSVRFAGTVTGTISTATTAINILGGTTGSLVYQSGPNISAFIGIANTGTILMSNGVTPIWTSTAAITSAYAITATNVLGGGLWQIPFQTGTNFTSFSPDFTYDKTKLTVANLTTSTSPSTGAVVVGGGVGIGGDLFVAGNFQVNGNTTFVNSTNLEILDKNITLSKGSLNATASDMAGITIEGPTTPPTILYRSASDSWSLNKLLIGTSGQFTDTTASTSTTSGALQIAGGIGIAGQLYATGLNGPLTGTVGATVRSSAAFTTATVVNNSNAFSTATGAFTVVGGAGIGRNLYVGEELFANELKVTGLTNSSNILTGAFTIAGGASITKDLHIGGIIYGTATNAVLASTATLALIANTSTNIANGLANSIPYQSNVGETTFSQYLTFNGSTLDTIRVNATTASNVILPSAVYGLDLQNSGINQSPAIRLSGSGSGFVMVSHFGTLRILQDSSTLTNTLMGIGLTTVTLPTITSAVSTQTGSLVVGGGVGIGGNLYVGEQLVVSTNATISGSVISANSVQLVTALTTASGIVVHNFALSEVFYHSGIAGNFTASFTNMPTTDNREYQIRLVLNQGTTGYYASGVQINGAIQILRWSTAPSAGSNRIEVQNIRILRANNTWFVMSTLTAFL